MPVVCAKKKEKKKADSECVQKLFFQELDKKKNEFLNMTQQRLSISYTAFSVVLTRRLK